MRDYPRVKLADLLSQDNNPERIDDVENEHYITLSLYGKGAHERIIKDGKYPVPFSGYRVSAGQFIYSRIDARNGAYGIISHELDGFVVSKDFPIYDVDDKKVLPSFLLRSVLSDGFIQQVRNSSFGATNRMRIKEEVFESYSIVVPPLEVQRMIVDRLDKTQHIIVSLQHKIDLLDQLVKARFVELFANERNMLKMSDICSIITDGTHQPPKFVSEGIPFIFVSNVVNDKLTYDAEKYITQETYDELIKRTPIEIGDVLLSTVGSYGHPAVVESDRKFLFQRHIAYLKPKKEIVDSYYLHGALLSPGAQRQIEEGVKGIAQKTLNLSEIKKMKIPVPDLSKQKQFADHVKLVDKSKKVIQKALDEAQTLFDSLMQQYFG